MGTINIDEIEEEVSKEEQDLHNAVDSQAAHKPSLSPERNSTPEKKKPGRKPKYAGKLVQLNFSRVPEPAKFAFTEFCDELKQMDRNLRKLSNQDILLLAMNEYGVPIPPQFIPDSVPSEDNRTSATNRTIQNIKDNENS
jgi:hypothetical protein